VLGQLRRALELATEEQTAGRRSLNYSNARSPPDDECASKTPIARGSTSFAQASVMMATDDLGVDLDGAEVVIIGAGQLASGIARALLVRPARLRRMTICNRTTAHGERLRERIE